MNSFEFVMGGVDYMRRLLAIFFIVVMSFAGNINLVEARNDVYVASEDNWDYFIDTDSIGREGEEIKCIFYMIDRPRTAPNSVMECEAYFFPDGKNTIGYSIDGRNGVCSRGSATYAVYSFARKYLNL